MSQPAEMPELRGAEDLPALHEATLGPADVAQLEADLARCAQIESVIPRAEGRPATPPAPVPLAQGFEQLRAGSLRGLQIRYVYMGEAWCDTLMVVPGGVRIVRMAQ